MRWERSTSPHASNSSTIAASSSGRRPCTAAPAALGASAAAPPDLGFAGRLRAIAAAAEQEAAAFRLADAAGLAWPVLPAAQDMTLSYELRRGGTRRGPDDLWRRFDATVNDLALALQGVALSAISRAFTMLADITHTLADEIDQLDSHS